MMNNGACVNKSASVKLSEEGSLSFSFFFAVRCFLNEQRTVCPRCCPPWFGEANRIQYNPPCNSRLVNNGETFVCPRHTEGYLYGQFPVFVISQIPTAAHPGIWDSLCG